MTILFSDGFESGDLTAWTGTTGTAPTVGIASKHTGNYGITSSHVTGSDYCYKYLGAVGYSDVYYRAYVRFTELPGLWQQNNFMQIKDTADANAIIIGIVNQNQGIRWWITLGGNQYAAAQTDPAIQAATWYCVEVRRIVGSGVNGVVQVWVDDIKVYEKTDCTFTVNASYFELGTIYADSADTSKYEDCAVVADAYIGPELAANPLYRSLHGGI